MHEAVGTMAEGGEGVQVLSLDEYGISALGAWLGGVEPTEAVRRRPAAVASIERLDDHDSSLQARWMLAWLDGLSALALRDREALRRARYDSRTSGHPQGEFLDRSLAAYERALREDRAGAGRELAALQWSCVVRGCGSRWPVMPNIATDRLAAATWLLESGDTTQASRLLVWYESTEYGWDYAYNWVTTGPAYLLRARIAEARHDTGSTRDCYQQFLRRYDSPMPVQRHLLDEGLAGLARVSGRNDPPAK
jgi:hypothetical protein